MANNRLYILDLSTREAFYLAKSNAPTGWALQCSRDELAAWLASRDLAAIEDDTSNVTQLVLFDEHMVDQVHDYAAMVAGMLVRAQVEHGESVIVGPDSMPLTLPEARETPSVGDVHDSDGRIVAAERETSPPRRCEWWLNSAAMQWTFGQTDANSFQCVLHENHAGLHRSELGSDADKQETTRTSTAHASSTAELDAARVDAAVAVGESVFGSSQAQPALEPEETTDETEQGGV